MRSAILFLVACAAWAHAEVSVLSTAPALLSSYAPPPAVFAPAPVYAAPPVYVPPQPAPAPPPPPPPPPPPVYHPPPPPPRVYAAPPPAIFHVAPPPQVYHAPPPAVLHVEPPPPVYHAPPPPPPTRYGVPVTFDSPTQIINIDNLPAVPIETPTIPEPALPSGTTIPALPSLPAPELPTAPEPEGPNQPVNINQIVHIPSFGGSTFVVPATHYGPPRFKREAPGLHFAKDNAGQFAVSFSTPEGASEIRTGQLKERPDRKDYVLIQDGEFSYTSPEGIPITLSYIADEFGYRPTGAHLP